MFAWGYQSRKRLGTIGLGGGGGLRLKAEGDSRQLALTSQKYTLKSLILKVSSQVGFNLFPGKNYVAYFAHFVEDLIESSGLLTCFRVGDLRHGTGSSVAIATPPTVACGKYLELICFRVGDLGQL